MIACIYYLYLFFTSDNKKYQRAIIAALFLGLSFMSKGPVSFYALLLPFLFSFGIVYKFEYLKSKIAPLLLFFIVGILLSGWWYWYTFTLDPQAFSDITKTEAVNWSNHNVRPFYYY